MSRSVLVVAAHFDDELLGCGGTIENLVSFGGHKVSVAICCHRREADKLVSPERQAEFVSGSYLMAGSLGVRQVFHGDLPDEQFYTRWWDLLKFIEACREQSGADWVFTHFPGDYNQDHQDVYRATAVACRPQTGVRRLWLYEVPSSTPGHSHLQSFVPNEFSELTARQVANKLALFRACYPSEVRPAPHPRSPRGLQAWMAFRGTAMGLPFAEAFQVSFDVL